MKNCFYSWDTFYYLFDVLNVKLNRIIPMVLTIGNHDVGYNALANVSVDFYDVENIPYYFTFNPQHKILTKTVPNASERLSYHYHILGPTVHFNLDSGYIESHQNQSKFINETIGKLPNLFKFANYHNPIYPSCTDSTAGSVFFELLRMTNW
jgi:hypothetical protein